jgi:hypothetical protein
MGIEERIEKLERDNRNLRRVMATLIAAIVAGTLITLVAGSVAGTVALLVSAAVVLAVSERNEASVAEVIRAQKIEIVGQDGMTRVALGETLEGAGAVATYDARGRFVAALESTARRSGRRGGNPEMRSTLGPPSSTSVASAAAIRASQR